MSTLYTPKEHTTMNRHPTNTKTGPTPDCKKSGYKFLQGNLNTCPPKQEIGRICKKTGHYAKMCNAEKPSDQYKGNITETAHKARAHQTHKHTAIASKTQEELEISL